MAKIHVVDSQTLKIKVDLEDALSIVSEASKHIDEYADEIVTIYEKMPIFDFVHFCFYAFDSARLFENMLDCDPKQYNSFSLDAPDRFFYTLYGGMAGLYEEASKRMTQASNEGGELHDSAWTNR